MRACAQWRAAKAEPECRVLLFLWWKEGNKNKRKGKEREMEGSSADGTEMC